MTEKNETAEKTGQDERRPLQSVRGMKDILPEEAGLWETVEGIARDCFRRYGYRPIRLPIVEHTALFTRSIGEVTDIVEKEMYSFHDQLSGTPLTLRPEGTAGCVRAVVEHGLLASAPILRLYYLGPMFRHENPQKDRYRQFYQMGVEAFGLSGPDIDAEQIVLQARLWARLGVAKHLRLQLNTLGDLNERQKHRADLIAYLERHAEHLDEDARRRLHSNPLRILDTKNPALQEICAQAPRLLAYLNEESRLHFEELQRLLTEAGVRFEINPRLVRGLDYYNRSVFEWVTERLGAQGTVCAGGRYDGLVAQLGGKPAPACGFAIGLERLLSLMRLEAPSKEESVTVYLAHRGAAATSWAFRVAEQLRDAGIATILHCGGGSFKAQLKKADASGAQFAVIIGDDEAATGKVQLKALRDAAFGQQPLPLEGVLATLRECTSPHEQALST
ncbi:MAG: histidine--tRNA ligase [Zoogloeaceae bacterium]|jgi:histidyl-tRNA synthetase|nr:histidine--tRNA ligase [Zoogloeaceae bacterium]